MDSRTEAILFLGIIVLLILGFFFSIIYLIVRAVRSGSQFRNVAMSNEWAYAGDEKNTAGSLAIFITDMKNSFFQTREGLKQSLTDLVTGHLDGWSFRYAHYRAASENHMAGHGYSQDLSLYILPRTETGYRWFLLYRTKLMKALPVEHLTEHLGQPLSVPEGGDPDWILVSDPGEWKELNLSERHREALHESLEKMYGIYFLEEETIYMMPGHRSAKELTKDLSEILQLHILLEEDI